jgi:hypothetical protein
MSIDILNNPEDFAIELRGTFNKKSGAPLIFQRSFGTLQKKQGPILPANPRTRSQQLNRLLFRAAINNVNALTDAQKQLYRTRLNNKKRGMTWRLLAIKECRKPNCFDVLRFDEGLLFGGVPQRPAWRFDEVPFDDAFMIAPETLPMDKAALRAAYPNINIDSLFPDHE